MPASILRIISDIHYADRASAVTHLEQLAPLSENIQTLICNGDATETRPEPDLDASLQRRADLVKFGTQSSAEVRFITGNHDPDVSDLHQLSHANGLVLITHGDILYRSIVPWAQDAKLAHELVQQARGHMEFSADPFQSLLLAHREAARAIPQRHQAIKQGFKYLTGFVADTLWPPDRIWRILRAWQQFPSLGQRLLATYHPEARFLICGHTHRPGIWQRSDGRIIINTGSFCPPSGQLMVDIEDDQLLVRRIQRRRRDFHPGKIIAQFALTPLPSSDRNHA